MKGPERPIIHPKDDILIAFCPIVAIILNFTRLKKYQDIPKVSRVKSILKINSTVYQFEQTTDKLLPLPLFIIWLA